ncbi:hypothetical protein B0H13DRAFT_2081196 [Mycena leptocephala]|nr:hypothetical protein B0H13DRAFT_2081196 [Mycena leptocephala]
MAATYRSSETDASSIPYVGNFFPSARHFVVSGGEFTSVITNYISNPVPTVSEFHSIQLGDLDLWHEIWLDHGSGVVNRLPRTCLRKIYAARIGGRAAAMTAAVYEGPTAEEEWRKDLTKYYGLRHPNVIQVYGTINSGGLHATIFYGDLIPIQHFFQLYRESAISTAYLHGYFSVAFIDAAAYIQSVSQARLTSASYTPWIRLSTGGLCIELAPCSADQDLYPYAVSENMCRTPITLLGPDRDSIIVSALTLHQYHEICHWSLSRICDYALPSDASVRLGAIMTGLGRSNAHPLEVAYLPDCGVIDSGWNQRPRRIRTLGDSVILDNGWTRFHYSGDGRHSWKISRTVSVGEGLGCPTCCWLGQSNNVLSRTYNTFNYDDIVLVSSIDYDLEITVDVDRFIEGYIFLCPLEHLGTTESSQFWHPVSPAYWSLDPSGREGFMFHEANPLGIPSITFKTEIWGWSWDQTVYAGLRKFHEGKGFDPESRDVALHLGLPFYHVCNLPFVHGNEV